MYKIIILNLGDTSTKISIFENETLYREVTIRHSSEVVLASPTQKQQLQMRKKCLEEWFQQEQITIDDLDGGVAK